MSFFSVLMPVYNTSRFLEAAIQSVQNQTFTDYEFLILDDGSTDHSLSMLREFESVDQRIHVYTQENQNLLRTRKHLIELATGEYLVFLDSDDMLAEDALSVMHEHLMKHRLDTLIFYYDYIDEHGQFLNHAAADHLPKNTLLNRTQLMSYLCEDSEMNSLCRKVIRRTCLDKAPDWESLPRLMMGEDKFISSQAFCLTEHGLILDQVLYHYRMISVSAIHTVNMNYMMDFHYVRSAMLKILEQDAELANVCMKNFLRQYVNDLVWYFKYYRKAGVSFTQLHSFQGEIKQSSIYQYVLSHKDLLTPSQIRHVHEIDAKLFLLLFLDSRFLRK